MNPTKPILIAALAGAGALAVGSADLSAQERVVRRPPIAPGDFAVLARQLTPDAFLETYLTAVMAPLRAADDDRNGLDRQDVVRRLERNLSERRAQVIGQALTADLDGDLRVTQREIAAAQGRSIDPADAARYDADADGAVTPAEIAAHLAAEPGRDSALDALMSLSPADDGVLRGAELDVMARAVFAVSDRDGDGRISQAEFEAGGPASPQALRRAEASGATLLSCRAPRAAAAASIIVVGAQNAAAMADVTLAGQDEPTGAAIVRIEPGSRPLYLILTSDGPIVWRLEGETQRIARVVVSSSVLTSTGLSASGVQGVGRDRFTALPGGCLPNDHPGPQIAFSDAAASATRDAATANLRRATLDLLGRGPDVIAGASRIGSIALPSGVVAPLARRRLPPPAPAGFDPESWGDALRFAPDGLVRFDPSLVTGAVEAQSYAVLPQGFGLAQLTGVGALVREAPRRYRVVKPIARLPGAMGGAHSVTLVIDKGVPTPPGDPVHTELIFEDGRPMSWR